MEPLARALALLSLSGLGGCLYWDLVKADPDYDYADTWSSGAWTGGPTWSEDYDDTTSSSVLTLTIAWTDADAAPPTDTDGDGLYDQDCSNDFLEITIQDPLMVDDWALGMVDTGVDGWDGEDCRSGFGGPTCHPIHARHTLAEACTTDEVELGRTTLFDHDTDPLLTYMITDGMDCFVVGDISYYDALGCFELM